MENKKLERRIEKIGFTENPTEKINYIGNDRPNVIITLLDEIYSEANKDQFYESDLFILLNKWMYENLCILQPSGLYPYGFKHKLNSNNELIMTLNDDEAMIVNFVNGEISSYSKTTDSYQHLITVPDQDAFDEFLHGCLEKINSDSILNNYIYDYDDLTIRSLNCLKSKYIQTIGDLIKKSKSDLLKIRYFGDKSLENIIGFLAVHNLKLKE